MNGIPAHCQPLKDSLDILQDELRDAQVELASSAGSSKAFWGQLVNRLRAQIGEVQKQLQACISPPTRISNLAITGIENTQGIQFFRPAVSVIPPFGTCPVGRSGTQPDNTIKLVARKTTVLRVYVDVTTDPAVPAISQLSGVLETRAAGTNNWHLPLTPYNAPIVPRLSSTIDRRIANHTLNFRIPSERCQGALETKATVFDSAHPGETEYTSKSMARTLQFSNFSSPAIRLVRIRYNNAARGMNIPAPTLADFWTTAQYVLRTYPIPGITIVGDSVELYDGDFTDISPSGNVVGSANWGATGSVLNILDRLVAAEKPGPCVRYLALIPGPPARQAPNSGWAVGRLAISDVFNGPTLAQELAHTYGRDHAPCGVTGDSCYPIYGTHPSGSIGENGFDYVTSQVFDPANTKDFMSYCSPTWVSPYTYEALMNSNCLTTPVSGGAPAEIETSPRPQEILQLHFMKYRDDVIVLRSPTFHIEAFDPLVSGQPTPYFVELHDKEGRILRAKRIYKEDIHTSLDDAYTDLFVSLPWQAEAAQLVFKREDQIVHTKEIEDAAPEVDLDAPFGGTGRQTISWTARGDDESMSYVVRYSNDDGQSWRMLATGITVKEWDVDFDELPGGDKCVIQVLGSSGFRTGNAISEAFIVSRKPRKPSIISPSNEAIFAEGDSVHFFGFAYSQEGSAEPEELAWSSNIDGSLGSGMEAIIHRLSVGQHRITLSTADGCGDEASTCITTTVRPRNQ